MWRDACSKKTAQPLAQEDSFTARNTMYRTGLKGDKHTMQPGGCGCARVAVMDRLRFTSFSGLMSKRSTVDPCINYEHTL